jgi:multidrug efflux pump subunit AcrB
MLPLIPDPMYGSLAVTIIGGLTFGTIITLILLPVFYALLFKVKNPQEIKSVN